MTPALSDACDISRLARRIRSEWFDGAVPDAAAALADHPQLRGDPSALTDLAYAEFCLRREAGEALDVEGFASRFPEVEQRLRLVLMADLALGEQSRLLGPPPSGLAGPEARAGVAWPVPGDVLAGCRLLRELGRGAFARVYLAVEGSAGDRPVALKVSSALGAGEEARTLGRLHHEHVVPILWADDDPGTGLTLTCMPFLGSATLDDVLRRLYPRGLPRRPPARAAALTEAIRATARRGDPPPDLLLAGPDLARLSFGEGAARLALALAEALAFLHARGLYHCDLKPSNVLLTPLARPLLLDFNLARRADAPGWRFGGTFAYMAPEMLRAALGGEAFPPELASRADLFSLGVMLHELLTGRHPFGEPPATIRGHDAGRWYLQRTEAGDTARAPLYARAHARLGRVIARCLGLALPWRRVVLVGMPGWAG